MTNRLGWLTDIHLDSSVDLRALAREVRDADLDVLLVGGDISTAERVEADLRRLATWVDGPLLVVLGNHDYYGSSIAAVRRGLRDLHEKDAGVVYLPLAGVVPVSAETAVVGHGGWADGRLGDYETSGMLLNDYTAIEELRAACGPGPLTMDALLSDRTRRARLEVLNRLGDEAAEHLRRVLPEALETHRRVVLLTHVPPFREATLYQGEPSKDDALPHFACRATGDVMRETMAARPDRELLVLCGHTHDAGETLILPNLRVVTGGARYGMPRLQPVLEVD